jgi:ATP-GRASP peptide maturase of grasp-with-spasm system
MIYLYSVDFEESTSGVMDWIAYHGGICTKLTPQNSNELAFSLELSNGTKVSTRYNEEKIYSTWFRKGTTLAHKANKIIKKTRISDNIKTEIKALANTIMYAINQQTSHSVGYSPHHEFGFANKMNNLIVAQNVGLLIPPSLITNRKKDALTFIGKYGNVVTKPIDATCIFVTETNSFYTYTEKITSEDLEDYDDIIAPSLLQQNIEKIYELRIFYLKGKIYSTAIFSQQDSKTSTDFRKYNIQKMNRMVTYNLNLKIKRKLIKLMKELQLDTGSIDMIKCTDGQYYFLEVNPVGQYDMISMPCNFHLSELIANELIEKN